MHGTGKIFAVLLTVIVIITACSAISTAKEASLEVVHAPEIVTTMRMPEYSYANLSYHQSRSAEDAEIIEPESEPYSDEEVTAIATTLAGECYDDKLDDKRNVARVICNRVSEGGFGDTILEVVSAKHQFAGYWNQSRPISESDISIAKEILQDWYSNNCEPLSEYLFFCSGSNRENTFRITFN